jgi:hypothetical protein
MNIYRHAMAMELVWPYVLTTLDPTVDGYINWANNQEDELYKLKYEQVNLFLVYFIYLSLFVKIINYLQL